MITPTAHFMAARGNSPVLRPPAERAVAKPVEMPAAGQTTEQAANQETGFWGKDGFSFGDLLDVINPLQHIPIVSNIYRAMTGDELSPAARLAGGALMGGPVGLVMAMANAVTAQATGKDVGDTLVASLASPKAVPGEEVKETQVASIVPRPPTAVPVPEKKEIELAMAEIPRTLGKPMETLALKKPAPFMPLPPRAHPVMPVASSAKATPALEPLTGFETKAPASGKTISGPQPETESLFPDDDERKLVDWYQEEHAQLAPHVRTIHAQYERAKLLGLTEQSRLDMKS